MTTFDELLAARVAHADTFATAALEYQRRLDAAWIEAARAKYPATVAQALKLLTHAEASAVREPYQVAGEAYYAMWVIERDRLDAELNAAALTEPLSDPPARTTWIVWKRVPVSTFYSQGFGAERYAMASADGDADVARLYGVEVRVVPSPSDREYLVQVLVAGQRDIEILTRRPGPSMREQIRAALRRGANVRVLHPYLPPGLEEKLGLDHFGNDLPGYTP